MLNEHLYRWPPKTRSISAYEPVAACFLETKCVSVSQIYSLNYKAEVLGKSNALRKSFFFCKMGMNNVKIFHLNVFIPTPFKMETFKTVEHNTFFKNFSK